MELVDPTGKQLAVIRQVEGEDRLEFPVGTVLAHGNVGGPRFSPDGREIAYWRPAIHASRDAPREVATASD
jgi:hypothetical protein